MQNPKKMAFDDGGSLKWIDKETLLYSEQGYEASIWVDYEPGLFKSGRVVKTSSIVEWKLKPEGAESSISQEMRKKILARVELYYKSLGVVLSFAET